MAMKFYRWLYSKKAYPELRYFKDSSEVDRIWQHSRHLRSKRVFLSILVVIVVMCVMSFVELRLARMLQVHSWIVIGILRPIALACSLYWLYNQGFKKPFQQTLREHLQSRGVPICMNCGYSLKGLSESRCPECGREKSGTIGDQHSG